MSTYLITGVTGGLGSSVLAHLSKTKKASDIAVLVRNAESEKAKNFKKKGYEVRVGDYANKEKLTQAFKGINTIYFVSGSDVGARLSQHKNVIEAAKTASVKHVVYTSAGRKDESKNSPVFPVMEAHIKTEQWLKESNLNYTILQHNLYAEVIAMFIGEKDGLMQSKQIFLPAARGKTGFALREDLAEAGAVVLNNLEQHLNKTYIFDGTKAIDFNEIAQTLSQITDSSINFTSPDVDTFKSVMASRGIPKEIIEMMLGFCLGIAAGEFNSESKDLERLLGREPKPVSTILKQIYA